MAEVKLVHIEKTYEGGFHAVKDVNLHVKDKEFVVLVGPSGCGKSTTLRMIAGLEDISDGKLYIGEKVVNELAPKDRELAMVFQNYALYPHMTVYQNMAFGLTIKKVPKKEIKERVMKAAKILELEPMLEKRPGQMSGGQRQRVAIGRAIVRRPKVFLFDEPLSNLDAKLRGQMRIEIANLHKKLDATMIYVTHDQVEAMTLGDRIAVLNNGRLEQFDTPINLYNNPVNMFVAGFLGAPPMNFVNGTVSTDNGSFYFTDTSKTIKFAFPANNELSNYQGKEVVLGVRSENITNEVSKSHAKIEGNIVAIEMLGNEQLITISTAGQEIISRISAKSAHELGQKFELFIDLSGIYFFDKKTELRII